MKTALICGAWSSNIGNAFFNLGALWMLEKAGLEITLFPESPRWKGDVSSDYDLISDTDFDLYVLVGPCLWNRISYVYEDTFKKIYERGARVAYLSAGMATYSKEEAAYINEFFDRFPPAFISTRDHETHEHLYSFVKRNLHDGICTSMFINEAVAIPKILKDPYIVINFDEREPDFEIEKQSSVLKLKQQKVLDKIKKRNYFQIKSGEFSIIRTNNLSIDGGFSSIYSRPNTYHSDLPQGYCTILGNASFVYSERVHTCATALAYGVPAQFVRHSTRSRDKRSFLFSRIGLQNIFKAPVVLNRTYIEEEKAKQIKFIENWISDYGYM